MDLAYNNLQRLICYKIQSSDQLIILYEFYDIMKSHSLHLFNKFLKFPTIE